MIFSVDSYSKKTLGIGLAILLLAILAAYSNHFQNEFHFDDSHAIIENVYIQDWRNIPRFFTDAHLFSTLPDHQVYQPVTAASLAIDYCLAGGLKPFYFQLSTFVWFLVLLALLFFIFRRIMDFADDHPANSWFALLAVACFGLHPAIAETVNYIIQRADVYSTLGVVGALFLYGRFPALRKWGLYVAPAVIGMLAKAPALIFPFILLLYVYLFEMGGSLLKDAGGSWAENGKKWVGALKATLPAFVVTIAIAILIWAMTPSTFTPGGGNAAALYRVTQPFVTLRYFKSFFLPTELSADTDWTVVSGFFSTEAVIGFIFVIGLILLAIWASRRPVSRPISFGILWFLLALVPTAVTPLAEVTNDHRMFFPFIGLALAVAWAFRLLVFQRTQRLTTHPNVVLASALAAVCILIIAGIGTWQRNRVWQTDESLWRDVTVKSPKNGRGLMNYGLTQMEKGRYLTALDYFERALALAPNYSVIEINLGIADGALGRDDEAQRHFQRALKLAPDRAESHYFYGRWLKDKGKTIDAIAQLDAAVRVNSNAFDARHLLMQIYSEQSNWPELQRVAQDTLKLAPNDTTATQFLNARQNREQDIQAAEQSARQSPTAEGLLTLSLLYYQDGKFSECVQTAQRALQLKPDYAEAYNNIAAGYNSMGLWDDGIKAASEAIRLKPDFELAKNNLAFAMNQKQRATSGAGGAPAGAAPVSSANPGGATSAGAAAAARTPVPGGTAAPAKPPAAHGSPFPAIQRQ
jgi:tetratricopeptide (TPR) repeat protein